jgi:hypothetical protein
LFGGGGFGAVVEVIGDERFLLCSWQRFVHFFNDAPCPIDMIKSPMRADRGASSHRRRHQRLRSDLVHWLRYDRGPTASDLFPFQKCRCTAPTVARPDIRLLIAGDSRVG